MLLASQLLIIALLARVCLDFARGEGRFVRPNRGFARLALPLGAVYFAAMVVRYVLRMAQHPEARWLGGTIPIVFPNESILRTSSTTPSYGFASLS